MNATGPGAVAGAIGVINQTVDQQGFGVTIATQLNSTASNTNVLAAGGTQGNRPSASNTNVHRCGSTQGNRVRLKSTASNANVPAARPRNRSPPERGV